MRNTTIYIACPYDNWETCPRLKRSESPNAARPFYLVDEDHPRGVVFLDRDELLSLAHGGSETVRVHKGDTTVDVLIVDPFDNEIRMTRAYFDQLVKDIADGTVFAAMDEGADPTV